MSWQKNTVRVSEVDKTIELFKEFKIKYKLTVLGKVDGNGLNDDYKENPTYEIRKLEYKNKVILEQMMRNSDCDSDDFILSKKFSKNKVPKKWKIEV